MISTFYHPAVWRNHLHCTCFVTRWQQRTKISQRLCCQGNPKMCCFFYNVVSTDLELAYLFNLHWVCENLFGDAAWIPLWNVPVGFILLVILRPGEGPKVTGLNKAGKEIRKSSLYPSELYHCYMEDVQRFHRGQLSRRARQHNHSGNWGD